MSQSIKRVDLKADGKKLFVDYKNDDEIKRTRSRVPHEDLTNAFLRIGPHLSFLAGFHKTANESPDWFKDYDFLQDPRFENIAVTGIAISGKDMRFIKLIGNITNEKKQVTPFSAPVIWLDDQAVNAYPLLDHLKAEFTAIMSEVDLYLGGKYAPSEQGELLTAK